jgi:hypothetical protein
MLYVGNFSSHLLFCDLLSAAKPLKYGVQTSSEHTFYKNQCSDSHTSCRGRGAYTGGADKSLARPGRKQATVTEDFDFHISYYNHNWRNISTIYI